MTNDNWLNGRSLMVVALGITAIVLFSLEERQLASGWLGFDILLVSAGYLWQRYSQGHRERSWNEVWMYALRGWQYMARRYLVLVFLLVPLGVWMLLPQEMARLYRDVLASVMLISNFTAWQDRVFLYGAIETTPMAHTWLLSLVAQCVLAALLIQRLAPRHVLPLTLVAALSSLVLASWALNAMPSVGFYFPVTRFWPFALGIVTALLTQRLVASRIAGLLATAVGLVLVALMLNRAGSYTEQGIFIQLTAVFGTCLLLLPGPSSSRQLEAILSMLFLVYLLHHPLVAILKTLGADNDLAIGFIVSMLIMGLALVHLLLRHPMSRRQSGRFKPFTWGVLVMAVGISVWGLAADGKILRNYPDDIFGLETVHDSPCYGSLEAPSARESRCVLGGTQERIAIIGDGHAATLFNPLHRRLQEMDIGMRAFAGPYCAPLFGLVNVNYSDRHCARATADILNEIKENATISVVVLYAQWANYTRGSRDGNPPSLVAYHGKVATSLAENPGLFESALQETITGLVASGKQVLLVTSTPEFNLRVLDEHARNWLLGSHFTAPRIAVSFYDLRNREVLDSFDRLVDQPRVSLLDTRALFCAEGLCEAIDPSGQVWFSDNSHLAGQGAERLADRILEFALQSLSSMEETP